MNRLPWRNIFAGLLAAFFAFGGFGNIFASDAIPAHYARWGYAGWFHYVTGVLELAAAVLIAFPATRLIGSVLGCAIMAVAAGTVLVHGEYSHAIPPLVVMTLTALNVIVRERRSFLVSD